MIELLLLLGSMKETNFGGLQFWDHLKGGLSSPIHMRMTDSTKHFASLYV